MGAIKLGKPSSITHFNVNDATDRSVEQLEAIKRLKIRRARGVIIDDPIGFDSSTDARYLNAPVNG